MDTTLWCFLSNRISNLIYQWLCLEVSIFYTLKELLCMFSICISSSNIYNRYSYFKFIRLHVEFNTP